MLSLSKSIINMLSILTMYHILQILASICEWKHWKDPDNSESLMSAIFYYKMISKVADQPELRCSNLLKIKLKCCRRKIIFSDSFEIRILSRGYDPTETLSITTS